MGTEGEAGTSVVTGRDFLLTMLNIQSVENLVVFKGLCRYSTLKYLEVSSLWIIKGFFIMECWTVMPCLVVSYFVALCTCLITLSLAVFFSFVTIFFGCEYQACIWSDYVMVGLLIGPRYILALVLHYILFLKPYYLGFTAYETSLHLSCLLRCLLIHLENESFKYRHLASLSIYIF